ncbi:MAG TPA: hypothetical protein VF623_09105 [Segetibacter sp.]|jgi:hypothetical protein
MMTVEQKFEEGYILGYIKYNEQCNMYLMPIAYWILNYKKYDPSYNPENWEFVFRENILIVNDSNVENFIKAIEVDKIYPYDLTKSNPANVVFYVDFDVKLFVSSFNEIEVEDYLPDKDWQGKYDNPTKYLAAQCKIL